MSSTPVERVKVEPWGTVEGKEVKKFTLKNNNNQEVDIISYGATITSIRTPDKSGKIDDVVCGFDHIEGKTYNVNFSNYLLIFFSMNCEVINKN